MSKTAKPFSLSSIFVFHLLLLCVSCLVIEPVDIDKIDYCKITCKVYNREGQLTKEEENTACKCNVKNGTVELTDSITEYRTLMVEYHNIVRNKIAAGKVWHPKEQKFYPPAAGMRAFNYDLELEYTARCWAVQITDYHDHCRDTSKHAFAGQNLLFRSHPYMPTKAAIFGWFQEYRIYEIGGIKEFAKFVGPGPGTSPYAHFTAMVWDKTYAIGCARSYTKHKVNESYQYAELCNFGGTMANVPGQSVYEEGPPCSKCPDGTTCNKKFPNLCGEIDPIPKDRPRKIQGGVKTKQYQITGGAGRVRSCVVVLSYCIFLVYQFI